MTKRESSSTRVDADDVPGPWARSVSYDEANDTVQLILESGTTVGIPRTAIEEFRDVPIAHMNELILLADGESLSLRSDDIDIFVPGLLWELAGFNAPVSCWSGDTPAGTGRAAPQRSA